MNLDTEVRNNDPITKIWLCKVMSEKRGCQVTKSPALNPPLSCTTIYAFVGFFSFSSVLRKRCSGNMLHILRGAHMPKCNFNKVPSNFIEIAFRHGCSPVNLLHIFRKLFLKTTSGRLLLKITTASMKFNQFY